MARDFSPLSVARQELQVPVPVTANINIHRMYAWIRLYDSLTINSIFILSCGMFVNCGLIRIYHFQAQVKFIVEQATKTLGENRDIALLFLNLGARWRWVVNATPRLLSPGDRDPVSTL